MVQVGDVFYGVVDRTIFLLEVTKVAKASGNFQSCDKARWGGYAYWAGGLWRTKDEVFETFDEARILARQHAENRADSLRLQLVAASGAIDTIVHWSADNPTYR